ncbi:hypothetical protein GobsT_12190 [Gemmata obscuriglobus]|uniref:DUF3168 domain-containing protein n=1 Tax=Gemmata obscuriglobus TaxID=114 RepID=A0A2Z3H7E9_9BACT|nr:hypothetical protein [Gemmata obscuriglobus]AWM40312.1 hypothetical protein C1280_27115 [Gemmata obscuriglobus]QEG26479.1 hypothetical protein GobsT_12190 [Gemmata obscuriglobus]VTS01725.1 unnamed protein product [Gemmata obscuriglobus UQM 2246]
MPNPVSPNLIADAVVAAVRALNLVPGNKVQKLKTPSLPSGVDPPFIAVCVGEGGEEGQTTILTYRHKINRYPTTVVIIGAGDGRVLADGERVREWRTLIEQAVGDSRGCFATVPGWLFTATIGKAPFDGSLIPRDLDYSAQTFNVAVVEPRST